jgi:hypothetical protein
VRKALGGKQTKKKEAVNLSVHQVVGGPSTWIPEILDTDADTAELSVSCHHEQIPISMFYTSTSTYRRFAICELEAYGRELRSW